MLLKDGPPEGFSNLVAGLFQRIVSGKVASLPANKWIYLANLRDDSETRWSGERAERTEMLIISLAMVVRSDPLNRKVVLRVYSQETEPMTERVLRMGARTDEKSNGDSRLRNYRLHFSKRKARNRPRRGKY